MNTKPFAALALVVAAAPGQALATFTVETPQQLAALLPTLTGPALLLLAPGHYGDLSFRNLNPPADVTLASADPANPAAVRSLELRNVSRLRFHALTFHRPRGPSEPHFIVAVNVRDSQRIAFTANLFTGSPNNDPNDDGFLLRLTDTSRVILLGNRFQEARIAVAATGVQGAAVASNSFHSLREGVNFSGSANLLIDRNLFTAIHPNIAAGDHADCIQLFQSSAGVVSHRVAITNNAMIVADSQAQGIFVRNSLDPDTPTYDRFTDLVVENNLYVGRVRNGLSVADALAPRIVRNTLVAGPDPILWPGILIRDTQGAVAEGNIAPMILVIDGTAAQNGNLLTRHPKAPAAIDPAALFAGPGWPAATLQAFEPVAGAAPDAGYRVATETGGLPAAELEARLAWHVQRLDGLF